MIGVTRSTRGRAWLALVLIGASCAGTSPAPPDAGREAVELGPELARQFQVRQKVVARHSDGELRFEAIVRSHCGELRVVGLSPFGTRAFLLTRRGDHVAFESFLPRALPFPPEFMLRDLQLTFFESPTPANDEPTDRIVDRGGQSILERWAGGRLVQRVVSGDDPEPESVIAYDGSLSADGFPARVELSNARFGYALSLENFGYRPLACAEAASGGGP